MKISFSAVAIMITVVIGTSKPATSAAQEIETLVTWMTGSFSSERQAESDSNYFDIRLEMVRIWKSRTDGYWLYVEQAAATNLDRPYRQRVYRVTGPIDGAFESGVFTIPDPLRFAGDWRNENPLFQLTPDSLSVREGCAVVLFRSENGAFEGGTVGAGCRSSLQGADYATSEVTILNDRIVSWDRGFNEMGQQVWGARGGGYVFLRVSPKAQTPPD